MEMATAELWCRTLTDNIRYSYWTENKIHNKGTNRIGGVFLFYQINGGRFADVYGYLSNIIL